MGKRVFIISGVLLFTLGFNNHIFSSDMAWQDIGAGNLDIRTACLVTDNPGVIYIGSKNRVLKTEDAGKRWRALLSVSGRNSNINFLYFNPQDKNLIYAASGNGLFYSFDRGKSWQRIFKGKNYTENECRGLAISKNNIYLITAGGLFFSQDNGRNWHKTTGLGSQEMFSIACDRREPDCIYLSSAAGVFKSRDGGCSWKKAFFISAAEEQFEEGGEGEEERRTTENVIIIRIDPNNPGHIYLSTPKGIYASSDRGDSWEALSSSGFIESKIRFLLVSDEGGIYALGSKRVFKYSQGYWQSISYGLEAGELYSLNSGRGGDLYVCAARGLFKTNALYFKGQQAQRVISVYFKDEPEISEVQRAAIKYAEVSPEKIERWRKQATKKAWLPQVSVGLDREASDLWHWETGSTTKSIDDSLRKGREYVGWDVSISWDLGELIWNEDQTSIDVRSRLMVELRDDILDNVTKLYFERIRLKMEIDSIPIEDYRKRMDKELRLKELTASLDALTGGYFSGSANLRMGDSKILN